MGNVKDVIKYKNNDGLVKAKLVKPLMKILGFQVWEVRVLEVINKASFGGNPKAGQKKKISERWFVKES